MAINETIRTKKVQYDIIREAAKISELLYGNINKNEYLTGDEKVSPDPKKKKKKKIEQVRYIYSYTS